MSEARKILVGVNHIADREAVYLKCLEQAGFTVVHNRRGRLMNEDELIGELDGVFGTFAGGEPYTERVFSSPSAQNLRIIARFGVGYDQVDVAAATDFESVGPALEELFEEIDENGTGTLPGSDWIVEECNVDIDS